MKNILFVCVAMVMLFDSRLLMSQRCELRSSFYLTDHNFDHLKVPVSRNMRSFSAVNVVDR